MAGGSRAVAIVGMACVMPGAADVEAFWANVVDGVDSVTEVPRTRWNPDLHFDPDVDSTARRGPGDEPMSVSKWGGWIPDVGFDALALGIPPASLASIDPAQLLALKVAADALVDAGYGSGGFDRDRASVIYATGSGGASDLPAGFLFRLLLRSHGVPASALPPELDAFLPELTEDGLPGVLTSVIAGRVANRLDLGGKNLTVDSACASVLVALDIACNELAGHSSDLVLCGGVDLHNGAQDYVSFTAAHALSRSGRCRSFDVDADGMTLAEGVGCLVLKRLDDAERDGDRIYAVVRGVAGSSDGRHLGLTAPRQEGQERAVRRAYAEAALSPAEVGLVEAHGTGTPTGDRTELSTTTAVFAEAGAAPGSVVIGSVKSNIGHIKCAAGVASLIKAAKAAYHGVLPPTLHVTQPNEVWDPVTSPFVFLDQARPWLEERRVVGVSSFGFGGTNFHALLERHPPATTVVTGRPQWPAELLVLHGPDEASAPGGDLDHRLDALATRLAEELATPRPADRGRLRDLAAAAAAEPSEGPAQLALVVDSLDDLAAKLAAARDRLPMPGVYRRDPAAGETPPSAVAFLFPGPRAVRPGMAADVLVAFPGLREAARRSPSTAVMLPPQPFGEGHRRQQAALGDAAGEALPVASLALAHALATCGVAPDHLVGDENPLLATPERRAALRSWLRSVARGEPADPVPWEPFPGTAEPRAAPAPASVRDRVRELADDGVRVFVEVGPGAALTGVVTQALVDRSHVAVPVDQPGDHGVTSLLHALAQLAVAGVPIGTEALSAGRGADPRRWTEPGPRPQWLVNGHCARRATGEPLPKGLRPAHEAPLIHIGRGPAPDGDGAEATGPAVGDLTAGQLAAVTEYLRILQGMVTAGSDIVRGHVEASRAG